MSEPAAGEANSAVEIPHPDLEPTKEPESKGKIVDVTHPPEQPSASLPPPEGPPIAGAVEVIPKPSPFSESLEAGRLRTGERPVVPERPASEDLEPADPPKAPTPPTEIQAETPSVVMKPAEVTSEQVGNSLGVTAPDVMERRRLLQARAVKRDPEAKG